MAINLTGVFPPVTTPFDREDRVDFGALRANIVRYNGTALAGFVVIGSTGESVLLREDEIEKILGAVRESAAPGKILVAGTGAESTTATIERTRRAAALGYAVALVKTPHYYKSQLTPDVLAEHFERVADASPIPVLLYSVPQFTGVALEAPAVIRLARHANIIGLKESSGNIQRITEIIAGTPAGFQTLVGSAQTFLASLTVGAVGGILAAACVLPELCVEVFEAARAGRQDEAQNLQRRLLEPAIAVTSRFGISGLKYAMEMMGYAGGPPRRPLLPLPDAPKREIEKTFAAFRTTPHAVPAR